MALRFRSVPLVEQANPSSLGKPHQQFELYQQSPREALRYFLQTVTARCAQGWHVFHHLGFLPHTSLKDKFPYYK